MSDQARGFSVYQLCVSMTSVAGENGVLTRIIHEPIVTEA